MASIPGSMRFKKESRSFKVEDTWEKHNKSDSKNKRTDTVAFHTLNSDSELQFVKQWQSENET